MFLSAVRTIKSGTKNTFELISTRVWMLFFTKTSPTSIWVYLKEFYLQYITFTIHPKTPNHYTHGFSYQGFRYSVINIYSNQHCYKFSRSTYILDAATSSSGILKAKQKLDRTFNSDKLGGIDFTKISKLTMCSA